MFSYFGTDGEWGQDFVGKDVDNVIVEGPERCSKPWKMAFKPCMLRDIAEEILRNEFGLGDPDVFALMVEDVEGMGVTIGSEGTGGLFEQRVTVDANERLGDGGVSGYGGGGLFDHWRGWAGDGGRVSG